MSNVFSERFFSFFRLRMPEPLSAWADAHRIIGDGAGPEPGRWRTDRTPYMREVMDAVTNPDVREIVMCTGIQLGKTELILNAICYYMLHEPAPIMLVEPSEDLACDIGCDRIDTMIQASPELRPLFGLADDKQKSRKTGKLKIGIKRFLGGYLKLASAASTSDLRSRPIRIVLCDEVDAYPARADGNAVDMAIGRASNFVDRKILITSTPSTLAGSEVWRRLGGCARYEYRIPCQHCGAPMAWTWDAVKWDRDADGEGDPATARIVCPLCGGIVRGAGPAPSVQLQAGSWVLVSGEPGSSRVGYHLSSLYSPWVSLELIVSEWLAANRTRDVDRLRTFIQERLAEPWDERPPAWRAAEGPASKSRFEDAPDHASIRYLTAGVDVQRDRLEVSVWGFGANMESWAISHTALVGDPLSAGLWEQLQAFLAQPVTTADGREGRIYAACIDSGDGYSTQAVYRFCAPLERFRVVAVKGVGGDRVPLIAPPSRVPQYHSPLYRLGVDRFKQVIYDRLNIPTVGPGYIHIPADLSDEFWAQLTAESPETRVEHGKQVTRWVQHRARNEALDCAVYALAAYELYCHPMLKRLGRNGRRG